MGRSEDLARDQDESVFTVNARFVAFSRYDYDLERADTFVDGVRWAVSQSLSEDELKTLRGWLAGQGVPDGRADDLARGMFDRLRCARLDPPSDG